MVVKEGLDCRKCTKNQKLDHGYDTDSVIPRRWQIGDWYFNRCPVTMVTQQSKEFLRAYAMYKQGFLPNGRGYLYETQKYLDAMTIIENEVSNGQRK